MFLYCPVVIKPKPVQLVLWHWDISQWMNLFRPSMTYMDLTHWSWSSYGKTGGNSVTLHSSSTYINVAIFVFEIDLKLNQIWTHWNFLSHLPPPLQKSVWTLIYRSVSHVLTNMAASSSKMLATNSLHVLTWNSSSQDYPKTCECPLTLPI